MAETDEEEHDVERNANHVAMDTISPFHHCNISPLQGEITNETRVHSTISPLQGDIASVTSERQIYFDILAETINVFNELTIQSSGSDN